MIAYYFLLTDHFIYIFKSADCSMNLMKIPKTLSSGNVFRKLKSQQAKKKYKENHERNKGTGRFENGNICLLRSRS